MPEEGDEHIDTAGDESLISAATYERKTAKANTTVAVSESMAEVCLVITLF